VRITYLLLFLLFWLCATCAAVSPVTADSIAAAQEYGKDQARVALSDFFKPWTVYEESADKLTVATDCAYLYTPFLLLASDSRDKILSRQVVDPADADKVLAEYNGYLVFGATLFSDKPDFAGNATAVIIQGKNTIKAELFYRSDGDTTTDSQGQTKIFSTKCYIYFAARNVDINKLAVLQITCSKHHKSRFYFDLAKFR